MTPEERKQLKSQCIMLAKAHKYLYKKGYVSAYPSENKIQMDEQALRAMFVGKKIEKRARSCSTYPFEIYRIEDGYEFFALVEE